MHFRKKDICIFLTAVMLAAVLCGCTTRSVPPAQICEGSVAEQNPEIRYPTLPDSEIPSPIAAAEPDPVPDPEATEEPTPEPSPEPTPEPRAERVEDDFFADAAFFGNSLMDGLKKFGGMTNGSFFAGTSASVLSVENTRDTHLTNGVPATLLDALLEKQYKNIYVLLGINELGFNVDSFTALYAGVLGKIAAAEPDARIFVISLTPITEKRSNSADLFTGDKILSFNSAIRAMAEEAGYTYLDLYSAFADENGWLPAEKSSDGVHFTAQGYQDWAEFMRTHYDGGPAV